MTTDILFEEIPVVQGFIGLIRLNRPQALNALSLEMVRSCYQQLQLWSSQTALQAVLIESTTPRAFCAGGDVREVQALNQVKPTAANEFFATEYRLNYLLHYFPKPVFCLINGLAMGGGMGFVAHSHYRIATDNAVFAMPETAIGFFPDVGASYFLTRQDYYTGLYLGLTGTRINAAVAKELQLIDAIVAADELVNCRQKILTMSWAGQTNAKQLMATLDLPVINKFALNNDWLTRKKIISTYFKQFSCQAIMAALAESNEPQALLDLATLQQHSPSSLLVTFSHFQRSHSLSLAECLQVDYRLACHFLKQPDFCEGVRAALIDKDRQPAWQPASLAIMAESPIENYFKAMDDTELTFMTEL